MFHNWCTISGIHFFIPNFHLAKASNPSALTSSLVFFNNSWHSTMAGATTSSKTAISFSDWAAACGRKKKYLNKRDKNKRKMSLQNASKRKIGCNTSSCCVWVIVLQSFRCFRKQSHWRAIVSFCRLRSWSDTIPFIRWKLSASYPKYSRIQGCCDGIFQ